MEIPRNATSYFLFGMAWVGFAGFWTGGAHRQQSAASENRAAFERGSLQADGIVTSAYRTGKNNQSWDVSYNFATPEGEVYEGDFRSDDPRTEGSVVHLLYAKSDPTVSRVPPADLPGSAPFEWFGAGFGALGLFLMAKFAFRQVDAAQGVKIAFVICASTAFGVGMVLGLRLEQVRYTVQVGDRAWSSPTFSDTQRYMGIEVHLDETGLKINGQSYGIVPNHAHVWIKPDGVVIKAPH